jgi:hypothetical protein
MANETDLLVPLYEILTKGDDFFFERLVCFRMAKARNDSVCKFFPKVFLGNRFVSYQEVRRTRFDTNVFIRKSLHEFKGIIISDNYGHRTFYPIFHSNNVFNREFWRV